MENKYGAFQQTTEDRKFMSMYYNTIITGRKFKEKPQIINIAKIEEEQIVLKTDYLPFADSNKMEAPNDHVLLEKLPRFVTFRNVKTNQEIVKDMGEFKTVFGKNYNVKEFYE